MDKFPWVASRVPTPIDATDADRTRLAGLSTLSVWFGLGAPLGLTAATIGWVTGSWEPMVAGFWLEVACCPMAIACALAAAFMSSRRDLRCPRGAVAGGLLGVAGVLFLVATLAYVLPRFASAMA